MKPNCSNSYRNNNGGQLLLVGNKRWNKQASHSCLIALFFLCNAGKKAKRKKKEIFLVGKDAGIIKVLFAFFSCFLSYNAGENEKRKKILLIVGKRCRNIQADVLTSLLHKLRRIRTKKNKISPPSERVWIFKQFYFLVCFIENTVVFEKNIHTHIDTAVDNLKKKIYIILNGVFQPSSSMDMLF
jgi:hypothetical protein